MTLHGNLQQHAVDSAGEEELATLAPSMAAAGAATAEQQPDIIASTV